MNMKIVVLTLALVATMTMAACTDADLVSAEATRASCVIGALLDVDAQCTCQKTYFAFWGGCGSDVETACNAALDLIRPVLVGCSDLTCSGASTVTASIAIISVALFSVMALF